MAAMIWDEQAQAFKEADVPMKYDPTAESWTGTTGLAWDNEAQAWTEKWNSGVRAYVYAAALETVTIRKNGIVVATVQTDSSGRSTEMIELSPGTYDMTGSVSGWTEEQTVDENATKFRAMPGCALYWYGNQCIWLTGGYANEKMQDITIRDDLKGEYTVYTNYFKLTMQSNIQSSWCINSLKTINNIDLRVYSKINIIGSLNYGGNATGMVISTGTRRGIHNEDRLFLRDFTESGTSGVLNINNSFDMDSRTTNNNPIYICVGNGSRYYDSQLTIKAIWFE